MIYNDLNESSYVFKYDKLNLYFSSKFYMNKFIKEHHDYIKNESDKLKVKFKCSVYADELFLLLLYKKIEKRGFRVEYQGKEIDENYYFDITLNGNISFK